MSNPRASIQRAVTGPPATAQANCSTATFVVAERPAIVGARAESSARQIGKAHGRMRCVNLCLSTTSAERLRQQTRERDLTLGETLIEILSSSVVSSRPPRNGRRPTSRRDVATTNVYVLLTDSEAADLLANATAAGRTISDYTDQAISNTHHSLEQA